MPLRKPVMMLLAGSMLTLLGACATTGPATVQGECRIFGPMSSSVKDTEITRAEIVSHNAAGAAACGWRAK